MSDQNLQNASTAPARPRAAFAVHLLTASGAGLALMALMAATRGQWSAMFLWLGVALIVDAVDGPFARWLNVAQTLPRWSGETLDLVVDFTTYVFVPAYAISASGLFAPEVAGLLGIAIVVSGALYFADRNMKADDNHFHGFPTLWNAAAFYLFLLRPSPLLASLAMAGLVIATFLPIRVLHPVRVARFRLFNIGLMAVWAILATGAVVSDFAVSLPVMVALCLIAVYVMFSDFILRMLPGASA